MQRLALVVALLSAIDSRAELIDLTIHRRDAFADGRSFGEVGPYEKLVGIATFAVDPKHPRNACIVDLDKAPRNAEGKVEFRADVFILAPKDRSKGRGAIVYDVNNRGNKLALGMFNDGLTSNDPSAAIHAGNGFLFRHGFTVVWCGWIGELLPGGGKMLLQAPIATDEGRPIRGTVRYEMATDMKTDVMPLSRRDGHGSYPVTAEGEKNGVLTVREHETDARVVVPRDRWSLEREPVIEAKNGVGGTLPRIKLRLKGGFQIGHLYELIAEAEGPIVQGLGFAATRDLIAFLKYDSSERNPVAKSITRVHGFGVSQSGRFLRHFLYEGFNIDEHDRKVFDGLMPHVAGGGLGYFNHRFAQPTRHNGQHEEHLYPADVFPFTYGDATLYYRGSDGKPVPTDRTDGILRRLRTDGDAFVPKIMHTQSAAEYWHRSGSLVHTDSLGERDEAIPKEVRIYSFGGTQHGPAGFPPTKSLGDNAANPGDYKPFLRALLLALDRWVVEGVEPPASVYPTIAEGTCVSFPTAGFPKIPGVRYPTVIQQPPFAEYGPEPPKVLGHFSVRVPKCDADGNDLGTLLPSEVMAPVATFTGWNVRRAEFGADGALVSLQGSYIPFAKTKADRMAVNDPRLSLEERYGSFGGYEEKYAAAVKQLIERGYVLAEDEAMLLDRTKRVRNLFAE